MTGTGDFGQPLTIVQRKVDLVDPHDCTDAKDALALLHGSFETLLTARGGRVSPGLAEAWSVSDDARSWRFTLRGRVRFHDGTNCTAAAAALSLRRMARPDMGNTLGASGVWYQYMGDCDIRAEGERTLSVLLAKPLADFPDILTQGLIAAPSMIDALDRGGAALPCGTGPYRIVKAASGDVLAERVTGHWRVPDGRGPMSVRWVGEVDPRVRRDLLISGKAEVATDLFPGRDGATPPPGVTYCPYVNPVAIIYLLNSARGPLADPRVRKALSLALDRGDLIRQVLGGAAEPLFGIMPEVSLGAAGTGSIQPDPGTARRLLVDAGFGDGLNLRLDCPTRLPDEAEALTAELARQLARLGISLDVTRHEDREAYAHMVRRKEIGDLCVFDSSPLSTFRVLYEKIDSRIRGSWWQGYCNPGVEADLDRARCVTDPAQRSEIYERILAALQDDPPWLTLYKPKQVLGLAGEWPTFQMPEDGVLDVAALPFN